MFHFYFEAKKYSLNISAVFSQNNNDKCQVLEIIKVLCFFKLEQHPDCKIFYFFCRVSHFKDMNEN